MNLDERIREKNGQIKTFTLNNELSNLLEKKAEDFGTTAHFLTEIAIEDFLEKHRVSSENQQISPENYIADDDYDENELFLTKRVKDK